MHFTRLDLSKNQLKFLTEDFCNLVNLKHLDLYNNQLENLPVGFGRLTKLRYLDLKGNPLQPALQKIVGPCLTTKDCLDAAKQIVPFMTDLEAELLKEKLKNDELEQKRKEEETLQLREQVRVAKKAARKERVMRERQEKAEADKETGSGEPASTMTKHEPTKSRPFAKKVDSNPSIFSTFLKTSISVFLIFIVLFYVFLKFLPTQSSQLLAMLPRAQEAVLRHVHKVIDSSISVAFKKVLSFRRVITEEE